MDKNFKKLRHGHKFFKWQNGLNDENLLSNYINDVGKLAKNSARKRRAMEQKIYEKTIKVIKESIREIDQSHFDQSSQLDDKIEDIEEIEEHFSEASIKDVKKLAHVNGMIREFYQKVDEKINEIHQKMRKEIDLRIYQKRIENLINHPTMESIMKNHFEQYSSHQIFLNNMPFLGSAEI